MDVVITQKGLNLLADIDEKMQNVEDILSHIDTNDARWMNNLLDKVRGKHREE